MGLNDIFVLTRQADALMTYIGRWIEQLKQTRHDRRAYTVRLDRGYGVVCGR